MNATIHQLLRMAQDLHADYGWSSPALFQRRLRVTASMARYLHEQLTEYIQAERRRHA